ncbi:MAG: hypothetical protein QJR03_01070 [Sphaerobacter sp.]|nr:hypothetical protein [Sphaerobacter sp.]
MSDTTWSETGVTYKTRPEIDGPVLSTLGAVELGETVAFDVTQASIRDGIVGFAITSLRQDGVEYASRESGKYPELIVTIAAGRPDEAAPAGAPAASPHDGAAGLVGAGNTRACRRGRVRRRGSSP